MLAQRAQRGDLGAGAMDSAGADTDRVSSGSLATTAARVVVVVAGACAVAGGGYLAHRAWNSHRRRVAEEGGGRKVVYLIRHGQSTFNAAYEQTGVDPMLFDAPLSALGVRQVAELGRSLRASADGSVYNDDDDGGGDDGSGESGGGNGRAHDRFNPMPQVVLTSPLTRALQTATGAFEGLGIKVEVLPDLRERLTESCDVGRPTDELRRDFPNVDFSALLVHSRGTPASTPTRERLAAAADTAGVGTAGVDINAPGIQTASLKEAAAADELEREAERARMRDGIWWYVDPDTDQCTVTPEACRRDFATYGYVEPEHAAKARAARVLRAIRRRPERCVALVGHADLFNLLAARIDPRGEELWLENCGVASYAVAPLAVPFRSPSAKGSAAA